MNITKAYILIGLISILVLIVGCSKQITNEFCEIGKEYEHNAVNPVTCKCPDGYEFETVSMGWGPCPQEGMSDCPASVLKCVKKTG